MLLIVSHLEDSKWTLPTLYGAEEMVEIGFDISRAEAMNLLETGDVCNVYLVRTCPDKRAILLVQLMQVLGLPELD